ncbi:hypothetical protein ACLMJK_005807 [Lecanora helva]
MAQISRGKRTEYTEATTGQFSTSKAEVENLESNGETLMGSPSMSYTGSELHELYHTVLQDFQYAWKSGGCRVCLTEPWVASIQESLSLLYMWAQGLDLHRLGQNSSQNWALQQRVTQLLLGVRRIVISDLFFGPRQDIPDTNVEALTSSESEGSDESSDDDLSSIDRSNALEGKKHQKHSRDIKMLQVRINNLMDMLPTIEHCVQMDQLPSYEESVTDRLNHGEANPISNSMILLIRDKFKFIDVSLANRLGEANWERFRRMRRLYPDSKTLFGADEAYDSGEDESGRDYVRKKEVTSNGGVPSYFQPFSNFQDSGLGASLRPNSLSAASMASHTSFLSTKSAAEGVHRVPPTPAKVAEGLPFKCPFCDRILQSIRNRIQWKCKATVDSLPVLKQHLEIEHDDVPDAVKQWTIQNPVTISIERSIREERCPVCLKDSFKDRRNFVSHVTRHMEEIALLSLPATADQDTEPAEGSEPSIGSDDIEDFRSWENSDTSLRKGYAGIDHTRENTYIPLTVIQEYFQRPSRMEILLNAVVQTGEAPQASFVQRKYLRPFAILLSIGHGHLISDFVQHDSLEDQKLPFDQRPANFPEENNHILWELFYQRQWTYCPRELNYEMSTGLHKDTILPFQIECEIGPGRGGSAYIYKIHVDNEYNQLNYLADHNDVDEPQHLATFVLKRYRGRRGSSEAERNFLIERNAFERLQSGHKMPPSIVRYHGSFVHDEIYYMILSHADLGNLSEFMQRELPPSSGEEIINLWDTLFKLLMGLQAIHKYQESDEHVTLGWHQNVTPTNILVKSRQGASIFDSDVILASFTCSHFKQIARNQFDTADKDSHGTYAYGAPETFRKEFNTPLYVEQDVDIWSLGCVYSVVASWITAGWGKVEEYRLQRQTEVEQKLGLSHGDLFHDGQIPLEAVRSNHENVKLNHRIDDFITVKVLDLIMTNMLKTQGHRLNADQLYFEAQTIVTEARADLQKFWSSSSPSEGQTGVRSHRSNPSMLNKTLDVSRRPSVSSQSDHHEFSGSLVQKALAGQDNIFIIDTSGSMAAHKTEVRGIFETLSSTTKANLTNDVEIVFAKTPNLTERVYGIHRLLRVLDETPFKGSTDLLLTLAKILANCVQKIENWNPSSLSHNVSKPRIDVCLLTDGLWQADHDVMPPMDSMITFLKSSYLLRDFVGIHIIRFGDDEVAKQRFDYLVSRLNDNVDIVDTTPIEGGNILRMLLGSITRWSVDDGNPDLSGP